MRITNKPHAYNAQQIADMLKISKTSVNNRINKLIAAGVDLETININKHPIYVDIAGELSPVMERLTSIYYTRDAVKKITNMNDTPGRPKQPVTIRVNGKAKTFSSISEACRETGLAFYTIKRAAL